MDFKDYLDCLKLSSKDAVIDGSRYSFNALNEYLHIEREVERKLSELITCANKESKSQLILLLGNVGDGKSHLLARMNKSIPMIMENFVVSNDATESVFISKSYLETLLEVFKPYRDDLVLSNSPISKTIIAINLGTLANFLDSVGDEFTQLRNYVEDNKLIDDAFNSRRYNASPNFLSLNLADFNIFQIDNYSAKCNILFEVIDKLTVKTDDNPFYSAYQKYYLNHLNPEKCPIKYNYDLISKHETKILISDLLIKCILNDKLIISVRTLKNFIYDLIVPPRFAAFSGTEIESYISSSLLPSDYYLSTLTVLLFDSASTSPILRCVKAYDPINDANEESDETIIKLGTTFDYNKYFLDNGLLFHADFLLESMIYLDVDQIIKLYVRLNFLKTLSYKIEDSDERFDRYIYYLFVFNINQKKDLVKLYEIVQNAIYHWNGYAFSPNDHVVLDIGRNQGNYKISQKLSLQFCPEDVVIDLKMPLTKFSKSIELKFGVEGSSLIYKVDLDYSLFDLVLKMNKGFRPNKNDRSVHVKFSQFVNELIRQESNSKDLIFENFVGANIKKYKLSYYAGFGQYKFISIE